MGIINRNYFYLTGITLVGLLTLAPLSAQAQTAAQIAADKCQVPDDLAKAREEAKEAKTEKCSNSKSVGDAGNKCTAVYDLIIDAVGDYENKIKMACWTQATKTQGQAAKCQGGQENCHNAAAAPLESAESAKKNMAHANNSLAEQLIQKGAQALAAKTSIEAAKNNGEIGSNVSEGAKMEQDMAKQKADEVAAALKRESAKNTAAASQAGTLKDKAYEKANQMDSTPSENSNSAKSSEAAKAGSGSGSGGSGGGSPSTPSSSSGSDSGLASSTPSSAGGQDSLAPSLNAAKDSSGGKSTTNDMKLDATPTKTAGTGIDVEAPNNSSGSSKMDTSLRDSLKKKLLGSAGSEGGSGDALGGMPFGASSAGGDKKGKTEALAQAGGTSLNIPGGSGDLGGSGGEDFTMPRSETDAAVKNLVNEFGANADASYDAGGRNLADIEGSGSGIEGMNGGNLFHRIRGTITRHLQSGDVVNGVNGKI